jgi:hypothetical protein
MATPADHNLTVKQGQTENFTVTYVQEDGVTPVNLTGWTARMQVRLTPQTATSIFEVTTTPTSSGVLVVNGPTGEVAVTLEAAATALLSQLRYVYDLFVYEPLPGNDAIALVEGDVMVSLGVTR